MGDFIMRFIQFNAYFFIFFALVYTSFLFSSVVYGFWSLIKQQRLKNLGITLKHAYFFPVSIIVPAYNEEVTIISTIQSLLRLDYHQYEIIVVDDGSADDTSQNAIDKYQLKQVKRPVRLRLKNKKIVSIFEGYVQGVKVVLIQKENGGKGDALNAGINVSQFPYFVTIDADSMLQKDALKAVMQPVLRDDTTIAVGGLIRISQTAKMEDGMPIAITLPKNPIISIQAVEYERSFLASRILLNRFNNNLIISGAFGLFKKTAVVEVGGYNTETLGEDMDLVMRMILHFTKKKEKFRMAYEPSAVCWTQVPHRFSDLRKQRRRWYLGLYQSLAKYREIGLGVKRGTTFLFSYYFYLFFELLAPFIELMGLLNIILCLYLGLLNATYMIRLYLLYLLFSIIVTITAFILRVFVQNTPLKIQDVGRAIAVTIMETFAYRYILSWVRVTSFRGYRKKKDEWGKIERTVEENDNSSNTK